MARRCKVPKASLDEIKATVAKIEEKLKAYKAVPLGEEALEQAKDIARLAVKENMFGLYRGEMLVALGRHCLENDLDVEAGKFYFDQAAAWLDKVRQIDHAVKVYAVPRKAVGVSSPPEEERYKDKWKNILHSEVQPGDIFNRRTSKWYWAFLRKDTAIMGGLTSYYVGAAQEAERQWKHLYKLDEFFKRSEQDGWGSTAQRLVWNAKNNQGSLYATPSEFKSFKGTSLLTIPSSEKL